MIQKAYKVPSANLQQVLAAAKTGRQFIVAARLILSLQQNSLASGLAAKKKKRKKKTVLLAVKAHIKAICPPLTHKLFCSLKKGAYPQKFARYFLYCLLNLTSF